ncbi:hypothetical protein U1Q18_006909 [Sarracenia purpurea var. burkii]
MEEDYKWIPATKDFSSNTSLNLNFKLSPEAPTGFLSLKLRKVEFNKLCFRIIGRENIPLHNQFIHSILNNACNEKVPLPAHNKEVLKLVGAVGNKEPPSVEQKRSVPYRSVLRNGSILSSSYQKVREETRNRNVFDHYNAPGPNGKTSFVSHSHQPVTERDSNSNVLLENGHLILHDIEGLTEQAINEGEVSHHLCTNLSLIKKSPDCSVSVLGKEPTKRTSFENRKEASARSKLCAPLGIPSCPVSVGGARKMIPLASSRIKCGSSFYGDGLLDTATLREHMQQIAATQGLKGVSMDCANLLNNGLDAYLKGLIVSCIELVGARSGLGPVKSVHKHQSHFKLVNGVRPSRHHVQSRSRSLEDMQEMRPHCSVCLLDFRVAMELNPHQLGEDWPLLLEKICTHACI